MRQWLPWCPIRPIAPLRRLIAWRLACHKAADNGSRPSDCCAACVTRGDCRRGDQPPSACVDRAWHYSQRAHGSLCARRARSRSRWQCATSAPRSSGTPRCSGSRACIKTPGATILPWWVAGDTALALFPVAGLVAGPPRPGATSSRCGTSRSGPTRPISRWHSAPSATLALRSHRSTTAFPNQSISEIRTGTRSRSRPTRSATRRRVTKAVRAAKSLAIGSLALCVIAPVRAAGPSYVDMTWMSISNVYYELGALRILTDGYITRLPQSAFFGGGGGLATTRQAFKPDVDAVKRVLAALGGPSSVNLLLTGHSHFDHSFDTATWSQLTGARIVGSKTTCFQAMAEGIPADRCTAGVRRREDPPGRRRDVARGAVEPQRRPGDQP